MGHPLPPHEAALYRAVSDVLLFEWDPIGVSDIPEAHDEYYSYLPDVYRLVKENAGAEAIVEYLHYVQVEAIGLPATPARLRQIAERLCTLRAQYLSFVPPTS